MTTFGFWQITSLDLHSIYYICFHYFQVICVTAHVICDTILIFQVRTILDGPSVQSDPNKLFRIASAVTYVGTTINFARLCLSSKGGLRCLLRVSYSFYDHRSEPNMTKVFFNHFPDDSILNIYSVIFVRPIHDLITWNYKF